MHVGGGARPPEACAKMDGHPAGSQRDRVEPARRRGERRAGGDEAPGPPGRRRRATDPAAARVNAGPVPCVGPVEAARQPGRAPGLPLARPVSIMPSVRRPLPLALAAAALATAPAAAQAPLEGVIERIGSERAV